MPTDLAAISYVFDENLTRLGQALSTLRADVECLGRGSLEQLLPKGILDTDWIPVIAARGWIMVTDDRHVRTRPIEAELALAHGLKVIHLYKAGRQMPWDHAVQLLSHWRRIEVLLRENPSGPWWLSVRKNGA